MSLKYRLLKFIVKAIGLKNSFMGSNVEELLEKKRKKNAKTKIPNLKDKDFEITRIEVMGFPVLKMIHKKHTDKANLFLIGTGMTGMPSPTAVKGALKIAKKAGVNLYVPYYPLCTEYPLTKAYEMVYQTYLEMLKDYAPEHISVLGYSSGGNLALGMISYLNNRHKDTPKPNQIISISPGNCLETEEEWQRLLELDKKDVITPAQYMKMAEEIMKHGDVNVPDYMLWLQKGDYSGCGKVTLFYGSDETLYGFAPSIEVTLKKQHIDYQLIVGEGLYHCYPVFPLVKEAKEGWDTMIALLEE